jgi:hypothetical protein
MAGSLLDGRVPAGGLGLRVAWACRWLGLRGGLPSHMRVRGQPDGPG